MKKGESIRLEIRGVSSALFLVQSLAPGSFFRIAKEAFHRHGNIGILRGIVHAEGVRGGHNLAIVLFVAHRDSQLGLVEHPDILLEFGNRGKSQLFHVLVDCLKFVLDVHFKRPVRNLRAGQGIVPGTVRKVGSHLPQVGHGILREHLHHDSRGKQGGTRLATGKRRHRIDRAQRGLVEMEHTPDSVRRLFGSLRHSRRFRSSQKALHVNGLEERQGVDIGYTVFPIGSHKRKQGIVQRYRTAMHQVGNLAIDTRPGIGFTETHVRGRIGTALRRNGGRIGSPVKLERFVQSLHDDRAPGIEQAIAERARDVDILQENRIFLFFLGCILHCFGGVGFL